MCRVTKVTKGVDEKNDKSVLQWLGHIERVRNNRIAKSVYVEYKMDSRRIHVMIP